MRILQKHVTIGDPHTTSDDADRLSILGAVFEPLVRRRADGTFAPCLATRWEVSPDARTWRFELRGGVRFEGGKPLEASDACATLARVQTGGAGGELGTAGVMQGYLAGSAIREEGPLRIAIALAEPMADFLDILVDIPILSPEAIAALPDAFIGTGPYRVASRSDRRVVLRRRDGHWRKEALPEELTWKAEPDPDLRLWRVILGHADFGTDLPPAAQEAIKRKAGAELFGAATGVCTTFMCNLEGGPCADHRVREALNYALDVHGIINSVMRGAAEDVTGPLTPRHLGYDPKSAGLHFYDPTLAMSRLRSAGYGTWLTVTLDVPDVLPDEALAVANAMATYYGDIGVEADIVRHADRKAYAEDVRAGRIHDAACFDSSPLSTFRIFAEKFHSGIRGPWWMGYVNARVDSLVDEARRTVDVRARQKLYRKAFSEVSIDAPWIFLYSPKRLTAVRQGLAGWRISPEGRLTFG